MAREYVPIFFDWLDVTQDLSQEQKGNLIDAAILYASGGDYESVLTGVERIAFRFIKGQIDRNNAISDARSKAGSNKGKQNETNDNKAEQTETKSIKEKDKEKDKNKENDKESNRRFAPPTLKDVSEYCKSRNNGIDAQHFIDYYEARGWVLKNGQKVKDWKACIRTWEGNEKTKKVIAQDFKQRDYSDVPDEMMESLAREMAEFQANGA